MERELRPDTSEEEEEILRENLIDDGDSKARFDAVAHWQGIFVVLIAGRFVAVTVAGVLRSTIHHLVE